MVGGWWADACTLSSCNLHSYVLLEHTYTHAVMFLEHMFDHPSTHRCMHTHACSHRPAHSHVTSCPSRTDVCMLTACHTLPCVQPRSPPPPPAPCHDMLVISHAIDDSTPSGMCRTAFELHRIATAGGFSSVSVSRPLSGGDSFVIRLSSYAGGNLDNFLGSLPKLLRPLPSLLRSLPCWCSVARRIRWLKHTTGNRKKA
jgi:hypothetical protein